MRAGPGQTAVVEHEDLIRVADGGHALRDQHDRGLPRQMRQRLAKRGVGGKVRQITDDSYNDFGSIQMLNGKQLLATRHSMLHPDDIFIVTPSKKDKAATVTQITDENKQIFNQLASAQVEQRWVKTTDGKQELVWIILPQSQRLVMPMPLQF